VETVVQEVLRVVLAGPGCPPMTPRSPASPGGPGGRPGPDRAE